MVFLHWPTEDNSNLSNSFSKVSKVQNIIIHHAARYYKCLFLSLRLDVYLLWPASLSLSSVFKPVIFTLTNKTTRQDSVFAVGCGKKWIC